VQGGGNLSSGICDFPQAVKSVHSQEQDFANVENQYHTGLEFFETSADCPGMHMGRQRLRGTHVGNRHRGRIWMYFHYSPK
jgi:hypothetical protein